MQVELRQRLALGHDVVDEVDGAEKVLQQRLAKHEHGGAAALELAGEAHEQQHVAQPLLGIEQDALAADRAAVPRRLGKSGTGVSGSRLRAS